MSIEFGVELSELLKTIFVYAILSTFIFINPIAFRQAGFTIENFFYNFLGNRDTSFLDHQLRRITLTTITHILYFPGAFFAKILNLLILRL